MKKKLTLFLLTVIIVAGITAFFTLKAVNKNEPTETFIMSTNPKEDIDVGKLSLQVIEESVNVTSNTYTYDFPFKHGGLDDEAGTLESIGYFFVGKRIELVAYVDFTLTSDLADVTITDISYDKETKVLTVLLPTPEMNVTYNTKTGLKKGDAKYEAIFSGGYSEEEMLRMPELVIVSGTEKIESDKPEDIEEAKSDIKEGLTNLLTNIESVKADASDTKEVKAAKDKKKESVETLAKNIERIDVLFKGE